MLIYFTKVTKDLKNKHKSLSAVQETRVRFLDQEDLLEEGMATHSGILA